MVVGERTPGAVERGADKVRAYLRRFAVAVRSARLPDGLLYYADVLDVRHLVIGYRSISHCSTSRHRHRAHGASEYCRQHVSPAFLVALHSSSWRVAKTKERVTLAVSVRSPSFSEPVLAEHARDDVTEFT